MIYRVKKVKEAGVDQDPEVPKIIIKENDLTH